MATRGLESPYVLPRTQVRGEKFCQWHQNLVTGKKGFFMQFKLFKFANYYYFISRFRHFPVNLPPLETLYILAWRNTHRPFPGSRCALCTFPRVHFARGCVHHARSTNPSLYLKHLGPTLAHPYPTLPYPTLSVPTYCLGMPFGNLNKQI